MANDGATAAQLLEWRRIKPGHLSVETQLDFGKVYKGAIQLGEITMPFGPLATNQNVEWQQLPARLRELDKLAISTGGRHLTQLEHIWKSERSKRYVSLRFWILITMLPILLFEFFRTRIGN